MKTMIVVSCLTILVFFLGFENKREQVLSHNNYYQNFDFIDTTYWKYQLDGFHGNACNMRKENVAVDNSVMSLRVELNKDAALPLKYNGGELSDKRFYLYGYFSAKMKASICKGTVSSFFLMNKWQPEDWEHKEIDIEFLGKNRSAIQCTNHDFQEKGKVWKHASTTVPLSFDIGDDFHTYGILWTKDSVSWFVDEMLINTEKKFVPQEPLQLRMNYYAGDVNVEGMLPWLGEVDESCLPSKMYYDWIDVETLDQYYERISRK